jgi:putative glutamine amidotransferase
MLNIHLGGSLHTDIHEVYEEAPRMRTVLPKKRVTVKHRCALYRILRRTTCQVNCLHSQSIDRLGQGLHVVARDDYDIIQAVEDPNHPFLIGVQWHPEYLPLDRSHQRLFKALVRQAAHPRAS